MPKRKWFQTTEEDREELRNTANAASLGWFFFAAIGLGYLAGLWLDRRFGIAPWGSAGGAFLGIIAGFVNLVQVAGQIARDEEAADRRKRAGRRDDGNQAP